MHEDFVHKMLEDFVHGMLEHVLLIVAPGDHIQVEIVLDVLDPVCVYTFIRLEIKTNTETVAVGMLEKVQRTVGSQVRFF